MGTTLPIAALLDEKLLGVLAAVEVALLVALLVVYIALRLLGKFAKFIITLAVVGLVLFFILSDHSILGTLMVAIRGAKEGVGDKLPAIRDYLVP